jgi:CRISPR/Cas system-associated exonuclease Cas4 (RecB family)
MIATGAMRTAKINAHPAVSAGFLEIPPAAAHALRILSPSQAGAFLDCPAQWYFKHELRLPDPPTGSLALGRAVHAAIAAAARAKLAGSTHTTAHVLALYRDELAPREFSTAELRDDEDQASLQSDGARLVQLYLEQALPSIQPARIEHAITGAIAGVHVRAIVDLVDVAGQVIELKTSSRRPDGISAAHALQATTYAILERADQTQIHTLVRTKTPQLIRHTLEVTPETRRYAQTIYPLVAESMATGLYPPHRSSIFCTRRNCAFWRACEAEYGGQIE